MKKKVLSLALSAVLATSTLVTALPSPVDAANNSTWNTARYGNVIDVGAQIRARENDEASISTSSEGTGDGSFTFNGGSKFFLDYEYGFKKFTLRSIGENVEVWVADDLSFSEGDLRSSHVVTQEQVDKLRDEFDNNIYQVDVEFFGTPDTHTGENAQLSEWGLVPENYYKSEDGKDRTIMLVDNIKDENYHDSSYPFYVAGFYSSAFESYFDRNIINIDTNRWDVRLDNNDIFGTIAHEYQHLIHDDNDSDEENWVNEGMADFAQYLAGYGHAMGHVNYFLDHPENSLVVWDEYYGAETGPETLADYGQAYLLQLYLRDQFGDEFIKALARHEGSGIEGFNEVLKAFGIQRSFNDIYRDYSVALAVDSEQPGNGLYNFKEIDLRVNFKKALETDKDGVPAWGSDYIEVDNANKISSMLMDGVEILPGPWKVSENPIGDGNVLWANEGDERDNFLIFEADLSDVSEATLTFDNFIEIEEQWDFGVVQISTDEGKTWTTLANENTRYDVVDEGHPTVKENLPGFTGYSTEWTKESFDLSDYAGQKVHVAFRYITDWGYNDAGWFIKNVEVPEIGLKHEGNSLEGFIGINELLGETVKYQVSFVNEKSLGIGNNTQNYRVLTIDPYDVTEEQALELKDFFSGGRNYMVVSYNSGKGDKEPVEYSYEIITKSQVAKK